MPTLRVRREPPSFRRVEVRRTASLSPRLLRLTLGGDALEGFKEPLPAASVRLLIPGSGDTSLVIPEWNGNEFLRADGTRPTIRTYTPRRVDVSRHEIDLDIVLHAGGAVPDWVASAAIGAPAALSGPGRGYDIDTDATTFVVLGDESAIPAISQLLEHLPRRASVTVVVEVAHADARHELPPHPGATVEWLDQPPTSPPGSALVDMLTTLDLPALDRPGDGRIWAAGEAAAMQRLRRHLFEERGTPRGHAVVRGYWKVG